MRRMCCVKDEERANGRDASGFGGTLYKPPMVVVGHPAKDQDQDAHAIKDGPQEVSSVEMSEVAHRGVSADDQEIVVTVPCRSSVSARWNGIRHALGLGMCPFSVHDRQFAVFAPGVAVTSLPGSMLVLKRGSASARNVNGLFTVYMCCVIVASGPVCCAARREGRSGLDANAADFADATAVDLPHPGKGLQQSAKPVLTEEHEPDKVETVKGDGDEHEGVMAP